MIQLAWRMLMFQKNSALAQWFRARTENARGTRKTMIVALARKLLIALWRLVHEGVVVRHNAWRTLKKPRQFWPCPYALVTGDDDGSRWQIPDMSLGPYADCKNGPAPSGL